MKSKPRTYFNDMVELSMKNEKFSEMSLRSLNWYKRKIKDVFGTTETDPEKFFDKANYPNKPIPGNIITFKYNPATKAQLKYYDMFPLVLVIKLIPGGFIGLNFHYLSPGDRADFMSKLEAYQRTSAAGVIRINITYSMLKLSNKLVHYKACLRSYKRSQIGNMLYTLTPDEWELALFLPTERFVKLPKRRVWNISRRIIEENRNGKRKRN